MVAALQKVVCSLGKVYEDYPGLPPLFLNPSAANKGMGWALVYVRQEGRWFGGTCGGTRQPLMNQRAMSVETKSSISESFLLIVRRFRLLILLGALRLFGSSPRPPEVFV